MAIKILCTLGPASLHAEVIRRLDRRGVDLFRLNLSHTPPGDVRETIEFIKEHTDKPLCLDVDGAQTRCGIVRPGVKIAQGDVVELTADPSVGSEHRLPLRPKALFERLQPGDLVSVDFDGALLEIVASGHGRAEAVVHEGGKITSNRAVTIDPAPTLPALTRDDVQAIEIGLELGIKHVALSFARLRRDVLRLRMIAGPDAYIMSKIETRAGVRNMEPIIEASDAVVIDRGDLSREIPLAHIPMHQKEIIRRANERNTPAFVATNLLESMVHSRRPTVAEANDIVNTLLDGAHGLVLAAETTIGVDPVATVDMVVDLIKAFEWSRGRRLLGGRTSLGARRFELQKGRAGAVPSMGRAVGGD